MLISTRGDKDKARMSQPDRRVHLVRKKYAHESTERHRPIHIGERNEQNANGAEKME